MCVVLMRAREFSICLSLGASRCGGKDTGPGVAGVECQLHLFVSLCAGTTHPASLGTPLLCDQGC